MNFKRIHIGKLIKKLWKEREISIKRTCNFLQCREEDIILMFEQRSIDTDQLLRWSKLLQYDLFRVYSQHLILFAPQSSKDYGSKKVQEKNDERKVPLFRKSLYTREIIDHLLELIETNQKTRSQIITEYKIPKTTLYRWLQKYNTKEDE